MDYPNPFSFFFDHPRGNDKDAVSSLEHYDARGEDPGLPCREQFATSNFSLSENQISL